TQILGRHGRTFQMPSRATTPPGCLPRSGPRLNILVALPEREIARITFAFCRGVFGGLHVVETLVRPFAVIGPGMNIEVHIAVIGRIRVPPRDEFLDHFDHFWDMAGGAWLICGRRASQGLIRAV